MCQDPWSFRLWNRSSLTNNDNNSKPPPKTGNITRIEWMESSDSMWLTMVNQVTNHHKPFDNRRFPQVNENWPISNYNTYVRLVTDQKSQTRKPTQSDEIAYCLNEISYITMQNYTLQTFGYLILHCTFNLVCLASHSTFATPM